MNVSELITMSLRTLGVVGSGETPTTSELNDGFEALNQMVDSWATERLTMYTTDRTVCNVAAGQQVYTIGPSGAHWTAPRPQYIDRAGLLVSGAQVTELPLEMLASQGEWAAIRVKGATSALPPKLYYEADYPNGQIALWPFPSASSQVALYTPVAVTQFTTLSQTVALPPGYAKALRYCLAVELAPEFGVPLDPVVVAQADLAKASLKRANVSVERLRCDAAFTRLGARGRFDWMTGESR